MTEREEQSAKSTGADAGQQTPPVTPTAVKDPEKDERMWAMFCHLAALAMFLSIPFANVLGPLIIWLIKKDEYPLVDQHGKEALNFQITVTIALFISVLLVFVAIGVLLIPLVLIGNLVFIIIAAIKTNNGEPYEYPFRIQFIR